MLTNLQQNETTTETATLEQSVEEQQLPLAPPETLPCFMVNNLTVNSEEQCKFMIDNDCLESESIIDYVHLVYCDMGHELRYASIALVLSLVIVLFLNLSAVADEFLCPNLLTVAKNLRMSDSLAVSTRIATSHSCSPQSLIKNNNNDNNVITIIITIPPAPTHTTKLAQSILRALLCWPSEMVALMYSHRLLPLQVGGPT